MSYYLHKKDIAVVRLFHFMDCDWFLHCFCIILLQVDGDTSTNDTVIALASGLSGLGCIASLDSDEATQLQACLDAVNLILYILSLFCHFILHSFLLNKIWWCTSTLTGSFTVLVKLEKESTMAF